MKFAIVFLMTVASPAMAQTSLGDETDYLAHVHLTDLSAKIADRTLDSVTITAAYLARIAAIDDAGPTLNAVMSSVAIARLRSRSRSR